MITMSLLVFASVVLGSYGLGLFLGYRLGYASRQADEAVKIVKEEVAKKLK